MNRKAMSTNGIMTLAGVAIALLVSVIIISLAGDTVTDLQDDQQPLGGCDPSTPLNCTTAYNISALGINATTNLSDRLPIIGTVVGVAVLIGIIVTAFKFRS